jgi:hypothetical protein
VPVRISTTTRRFGRRASPSSGQVPVSSARPRSLDTPHECFVMDASVSVKTAETAEIDETRSSALAPNLRLLFG